MLVNFEASKNVYHEKGSTDKHVSLQLDLSVEEFAQLVSLIDFSFEFDCDEQ